MTRKQISTIACLAGVLSLHATAYAVCYYGYLWAGYTHDDAAERVKMVVIITLYLEWIGGFMARHK